MDIVRILAKMDVVKKDRLTADEVGETLLTEIEVIEVLVEVGEVSEAVVSHKKGTAKLTLTADVANEVLKKTVEDQGYPVLDIK